MDDVGDGGIDGDDATVDEVATLVLETNVTAEEVETLVLEMNVTEVETLVLATNVTDEEVVLDDARLGKV